MSDIQSISQGNYILQGTVATSAGIVGDGSTQNPIRLDETVLWENVNGTPGSSLPITLVDSISNYEKLECEWNVWDQGDFTRVISVVKPVNDKFVLDACYWNTVNDNLFYFTYPFYGNGTTLSMNDGKYKNLGNTAAVQNAGKANMKVFKIVGINRIGG